MFHNVHLPSSLPPPPRHASTPEGRATAPLPATPSRLACAHPNQFESLSSDDDDENCEGETTDYTSRFTAMLSSNLSTDPAICDSGCTSILVRASFLQSILHLYTPDSSLPPALFKIPDGTILTATSGGHLHLPSRPPVPIYSLPDTSLSHNLVGVSPLLAPDAHAIFTPTSVRFYSPLAAAPFLSGTKSHSSGLWELHFPPPPSSPSAVPIEVPWKTETSSCPSFPSDATAKLPVSSYPTSEPAPSISNCLFSRQEADLILSPSLPSSHTIPLHPALFAIRNVADASFVARVHRCFGCPSLSTFLRAIRAGWLRSIPNLTAALVSRNLPLAPETALGHLDTVRQGLRSTRSPDPVTALFSSHPALLSDDISQLPPLSFTVTPRRDWAGADLTGRFPVKSRRLNEYILITVFKGYIHAEPMPTKSAASYLKAYTSTITFFHSRGHTITHLTIDNEFSSDLDSYFRSPSVSVTVQFQPPSNHRTNFAERAIRTFKNHMIATLSSVHTQFPLDLWDQLLPHIELTLNHLRPFHGNPSISAHHGIHANPVDFLAHPSTLQGNWS